MDATIEMDSNVRQKVRQMYIDLQLEGKSIPDMRDIEEMVQVVRAAGKSKSRISISSSNDDDDNNSSR